MAITMEWRKTGMAYWMFSYVKEIFRRWNWHSRRWRDLIFPHHENEIAQSEAANGCDSLNIGMHNGFLNINNKKMSKSLGNFFTVRDISEKYDLQVLRFFMLSAHYRSPLNFSDDLMESAKNGLERIITSGAKIRDIISNGKDGKVTDAEAKLLDEAKEYITKFEEAMDDDCNTANAISAVFELVKFANSNLNEGSTKEFAARCIWNFR